MDAEFFSFLFNVFLFIGVVIAIKDRGQINSLLQKISHLQRVLDFQTNQIEKLKRKVAEISPPTTESTSPDEASLIAEIQERVVAESQEQPLNVAAKEETRNPWFARGENDEQDIEVASNSIASEPKTEADASSYGLENLLKGNGLFWLGAFVLAIGGIFLAKYSIEAGLLPPSVRVIMGSIFGVLLVVAAETVNRYKEKLNVNTPYISAALASGGVITCFSMALVSFDFYQFITPNIAFALLAVISLVSTYLALRFGPVLAGIGIIGSYAVPALVSTGSNNVLALLLYVSFVSLSAVWVAEYVKQKWLWWQSFIGHFIWFAAAILIGNKAEFAIILAFAVMTLFLYVLTTLLGWRLSQTNVKALPLKLLLMPRREHVVILLALVLTAVHLTLYSESNHVVWASLLLSIVIMASAYRHSALDSWPYLMLAFGLYAYSLMPTVTDFTDNLFPFSGRYLFIQLAVVVAMLFSLFMSIRFNGRNAYLLLLVTAPIALYGVSYITAPIEAETYLYPVWALEMLLIGALASIGAMRVKGRVEDNLRQVAYLILANSMLSLCFTMLLSASTLTVALAAQVASMSYLSWKYKVRIPDWIYKLALLVVVTRLTFAPWLAGYKNESILSIHWTLVVYPMVLAIIWFATKYNPSKQLNAWFMGVFMHVLALLVTTETSYMLIGKYPDFLNMSYQESILLAFNWLILAGVYLWRSQLTENMTRLYQVGGLILLAGSAIIHLDISLFNNPFIERHFVGTGLINWTVLQWLLPALALSIIAIFKLVEERLTSVLYAISAVFAVFFINGEIRNLFNDGYLFWVTPLKQAELYTYSIVWLIVSTVTIFVAQHLNHKKFINAGFIGLALVILKAFGVDMSHLEGLLRALSFIGLGLCLVGIGWLFQKMQEKPQIEKAV